MQGSSSDSVRFAELAKSFCAWCKSEFFSGQPDNDAAVWMAQLHAAALLLPEVDCGDAEGEPDLPQALLSRARKNLQHFSGMHYRKVFDPDPSLDEPPVVGDVGDDLLDTYKNIKTGCVLADRGCMPDALWHWKFLHQFHWGNHAVSALVALHAASNRGAA